MPESLAFLAYETPFAPCGGIAAVMDKIPSAVQRVSRLSTCVISPLHHRVHNSAKAPLEPAGEFSIRVGGSPLLFKLFCHRRNDLFWYFVAPEDDRFFAGCPHPYRMNQRDLLRDSVLFGMAAVTALDQIDSTAEWTLLLQDWQAATAALAAKNLWKDHRLFLTLHNSYDSPVEPRDLEWVGIDPNRSWGGTILQRALGLVERTVFTVSDQFARDFFEDKLQNSLMASHLQDLLRGRLVGVDNGPFTTLQVDEKMLDAGRKGGSDSLRGWKEAKRTGTQAALEELEKIRLIRQGFETGNLTALREWIKRESDPNLDTLEKKLPPNLTVWGNIAKFKVRDDAPWFFMGGRDDPRQKGYDVAAAAVHRYLEECKTSGTEPDARFWFFPIPGDEEATGLCFLKDLAENHPEYVLALPFRWAGGFLNALQGATFGLMPSLYEPFGMANEFYLSGVVGIGRATGGIVQQIVPDRKAKCFSESVERVIGDRYSSQIAPTGLLHREPDGIPTEVQDWRGLNSAAYRTDGFYPNRMEERQRYPLYNEMVSSLLAAIGDAIDLYRNRPDRYYRMLVAGIDHIRNTFSWERASKEYLKHL